MNHHITNANIKEWARDYDGPQFDGILCDPPYELGFMGKSWDSSGIAFDKDMWADILKLLKPGGHLLAFSGSRTYHRMAVAIEDAGFEIRDQLIWMYGCLSEDTEILTVDGWKRYHKAILSDTVVCYNIDNDNYELHKPTDKFYYDNKHTAYRIKSDTTDQIVSRNHRVIVERNGRKVFAQAETLERQESVPVLESLSALPDTIYGADKRASITKQSLLKKVWQQDDSRKEQWQEAGKDTVSSLQGNVLPNGQKQEQPTQGMFKRVQRLLTGSRVEETRPQGQSQLETRKRTGTGNKNDWRNQSKLERWFDLSEQKRQVRKSSDKIRQMSERILGYGSDRRLCYGTPIASSTADWQTTNTLGVSTPRQSRRNRQSYRKLNAIQDERGTQEIRVGSRHNTTLATVEPIEYTGKVWCVTVPTGAFVARRNGQIFITGNSGFPKSLNIGKAVDKIQGNEREVTGIKEQPLMTNHYGKGLHNERPIKELEETKGNSEWEGYGTALKPAHEPCVLARKPLDKGMTVAGNVLKHGTGGLNIDGTRVEGKWVGNTRTNSPDSKQVYGDYAKMQTEQHPSGRFPANLIHDGSDEVEVVFPQTTKAGNKKDMNKNLDYSATSYKLSTNKNPKIQGDNGGSASRYFFSAKPDLYCSLCYGIIEVCENNAQNVQTTSQLGTQASNTAQNNVVVKQAQEPKDKPLNKTNNAHNAVNGSASINQTIVNTAQPNVTQNLKELTDLLVKYVGNQCQKCSTNTAQSLAAILLSGEQINTGQQTQTLLWLNELTQEQLLNILIEINNLAKSAVNQTEELNDTTQIIRNLKKLYGSVNQTISESTQARFKYQSKASKSERNAGLEGFEEKRKAQLNGSDKREINDPVSERFLSQPMANVHPTVKPLSLTKYLATLIKPPTGGRLLVPFSGSGSEMIGALQAGWEYVEGVELTEDYIPIAEARIKHWLEQKAEEDNKPKQESLL